MGIPNQLLSQRITLADLEGNVHPILHQLRDEEPVAWIPVLNAWLITRRDLTVEVMRDAVTYTVDHPGFSTGQVVGPSMLSLDGKEHQRHRAPFEFPFRKREVESRFNQLISEQIDELIAGFYDNGYGELRRALAGPIAVKIMIDALGLSDTPVSDVLNWYDNIVDAVTRVTAGEPVSKTGKEAYAALRDSLLPSIHGDAHDSLLAAASGAAQGLTETEIVSNAAILLFGGIETTEGMIANAFFHLLTNQTSLEELLADESLIAQVIEESLRLEPAATVIDRYATQNVELHGAKIKEGDLVRISLAGANRDPEIFDNPDEFNPHRDNLRSHVTFAQGPHVCLGIHLARIEAQQAVLQTIKRLKNLHLDPEKREEASPTGLVFRKPKGIYAGWGVGQKG